MSTKKKTTNERRDDDSDPPWCNCPLKRRRHRAQLHVCIFDYLELEPGTLCFDEKTGEHFEFPGPRKRLGK